MDDSLREYTDRLLQLAREPHRSERDRSALMMRERLMALELMYLTEPAELRRDWERMLQELPREMAELEQWLRDELRRVDQ